MCVIAAPSGPSGLAPALASASGVLPPGSAPRLATSFRLLHLETLAIMMIIDLSYHRPQAKRRIMVWSVAELVQIGLATVTFTASL
jgi:hypothetical protein